MPYRTLDASKVVDTLTRLQARIGDRFPESGLSKVCDDVRTLALATAGRVQALSRPRLFLRVGVWSLTVAGVAAQLAMFAAMHPERLSLDAESFLPVLEPAVNLLILFGGAVWFLVTLEERLKRNDALAALHELRSLAHVIDMHQLTKDPTLVLRGHNRTAASPERAMSQFELTRYLDYCAEMLALIGKLAALYAERMRDPIVIEAVNELEALTTSLGRKIWQKIMIIGDLSERPA
ncbi:MAG: hypothetical protein GC189_02200 [Alphaproteobacteria bacterium]|nr:hypothetical protein [Alphaproteobacteria bacterium]